MAQTFTVPQNTGIMNAFYTAENAGSSVPGELANAAKGWCQSVGIIAYKEDGCEMAGGGINIIEAFTLVNGRGDSIALSVPSPDVTCPKVDAYGRALVPSGRTAGKCTCATAPTGSVTLTRRC